MELGFNSIQNIQLFYTKLVKYICQKQNTGLVTTQWAVENENTESRWAWLTQA